MNICFASRLFSTPSLDVMLLLLLLFYSAVHKGSRVNSRVSCTIEWIVWLRMVYALCSSYIYGVNFVWYLCWFPLEIFISNILTIKLKWMKKQCCWDGNHTQTANARGCIKWNWNKSGSHWKWKFSNEMDILHFIFRRNTQINKNPPKSKCLFNCGAVESKKKNHLPSICCSWAERDARHMQQACRIIYGLFFWSSIVFIPLSCRECLGKG